MLAYPSQTQVSARAIATHMSARICSDRGVRMYANTVSDDQSPLVLISSRGAPCISRKVHSPLSRNGSTPTQITRDVDSIPALGTMFAIFITSTMKPTNCTWDVWKTRAASLTKKTKHTQELFCRGITAVIPPFPNNHKMIQFLSISFQIGVHVGTWAGFNHRSYSDRWLSEGTKAWYLTILKVWWLSTSFICYSLLLDWFYFVLNRHGFWIMSCFRNVTKTILKNYKCP